MTSVLRSAAFNALFLAWTAVLCIAGLPLLAAPRRLVLAYGRAWCQGVMWLARRCVGLEFELRGRDNLPALPAIFAAKHQSAWETIALPLVIRDPAIVLKRELLWIPIFGWYLARLGMIAIDRGGGAPALRRLVAAARARLAAGRPVLMFPEGTRVAPGERRAFQPGIAALYLACDAPVVPVALNSGLFWRRRRFVKRSGRVLVRFEPPIAPGLARDDFMATLERRIEAATEALLQEALQDRNKMRN